MFAAVEREVAMRKIVRGIAASVGTVIGAIAITAFAGARPGDEPPEAFTDLIHADLPIFPSAEAEMWPRRFEEAETGNFGCTSRIAFGDWVLRSGPGDDDDDEEWRRIENYGVFHCFALVSSAKERNALDGVDARPSFFVEIGESDGLELWALQIGTRPGSDYLLLAREPGPGAIYEFTVLQRRCLDHNIRNAGSIDSLITRYCAINSKGELRSLARRMAKLAPLGTLAVVADQSDRQIGD